MDGDMKACPMENAWWSFALNIHVLFFNRFVPVCDNMRGFQSLQGTAMKNKHSMLIDAQRLQ